MSALNERSELSPEMALRIEMALGPKADVMMGIQTDYAMARACGRLPEIMATVRRIVRSRSRTSPAAAHAGELAADGRDDDRPCIEIDDVTTGDYHAL